jgi:5-(carboxyamino)imidazole ribonucleotide synthase
MAEASGQSGRGPLPPGSHIGILGSGQLGRMLALAAARLGLKTHVYSDESGPAFDVAPEATKGAYDDAAALDAFARSVDVVTFEFENVPVATAEQLARTCPVRPGPAALRVAQDRLVEKRAIQSLGIPVAPFHAIASLADLERAVALEPAGAILKTRRLGYDGKGQVALAEGTDLAAALADIRHAPAILERRLSFAFEVSVLIVRGLDGASAIYDLPRNEHGGGILRRSTVPSGLPPPVVARAHDIARRIAAALDYVGLLAVELFFMGPDAAEPLLVNEIAPRVHNSGHWTIEACCVSQFENHIRAVAGWPLGSPDRHSDAEMVNLIGGDVDAWATLAAEPGVCLHLYGKREARTGRKMGHWTRLRPLSGR